jgi:hypothetical protein
MVILLASLLCKLPSVGSLGLFPDAPTTAPSLRSAVRLELPVTSSPAKKGERISPYLSVLLPAAKSQPMTKSKDLCQCGNPKSNLAKQGRICFLQQAQRASDKICPQCAGPKNKDAKICFQCHRGIEADAHGTGEARIPMTVIFKCATPTCP